MKVGENLSIVSKKIKHKESGARPSVHHVWWVDRSGSMHGNMESAIKALHYCVDLLPDDDFLSIGWFSGPGEHGFIVKFFSLASERKVVHEQLERYKSTMGCTLFSECLSLTNSEKQNMKNINLAFFTDGHPTVGSYQKERESVLSTLKEMRPTTSLMIGFGEHYNRVFLQEMAEAANGQMCHCTSINDYVDVLSGQLESEVLTTKVSVGEVEMCFGFSDGGLKRLHVIDGHVEVPTDMPEVFFVTKREDEKTRLTKKMIRACYAAAYLYSQVGKMDVAIDILCGIGDTRYSGKLLNAITPNEISDVESEIYSILPEDYAKVKLAKERTVPNKNAPCVLKVIENLYANKLSFTLCGYKCTGRKTIPQTDLVFEPLPDEPMSPCDLVWNDSELNLSIRTVVRGFVALPQEAEQYNFCRKYACKQWRTYTIIKDGKLNVNNLMTPDGVIALQGLPIINREIASCDVTSKEAAELAVNMLERQAAIKVLKYFLKDDETESSGGLTPEQESFLASCHIKGGFFNPPTTKELPTDEIEVHTFDIKIAGFSSLPPVKKALEKIEQKKNLTPSEALVLKYYGLYKDATNHNVILKRLQSELYEIRNTLQRLKFILVLGNKWFSDKNGRADNNIEYNGYSIKFEIGLKTEKI